MTNPQSGESAELGGGGFSQELWLSHTDESHVQGVLQDRIWDEIHADPAADRGRVSVEVEDFVATLTGAVPTEAARLAVQHAAERVREVRAVVNRLAVGT